MLKVFFKTRELAREYARKNMNTPKDAGSNAPFGKRWYCLVAVQKKTKPEPPTGTMPIVVKRQQPANGEVLKKKIIVIINAHKEEKPENIEKCFGLALDNWKANKPQLSLKQQRITARADLQALFSG